MITETETYYYSLFKLLCGIYNCNKTLKLVRAHSENFQLLFQDERLTSQKTYLPK